jgi:hypothetical protein
MNKKSTPSQLSHIVIGSMTIVIGLIALLILGAALSQAMQNSGAAVSSPAPLQTMATLYPTDFPIDKQLLEQQIEQTHLAALTGPPPPTGAKEGPPTPAATEAPWPLGIVEDGESPFSASFVFKNRWQGIVDNQRLIAYAGYTKSDPLQGVILIWEGAFDPSNSIDTLYFSPVKDGALQIVAENDLRLTLKTENDQVLYFDIPSRQYVDSLAGTLPPTIVKLSSPPPPELQTAYPGIAG